MYPMIKSVILDEVEFAFKVSVLTDSKRARVVGETESRKQNPPRPYPAIA